MPPLGVGRDICPAGVESKKGLAVISIAVADVLSLGFGTLVGLSR